MSLLKNKITFGVKEAKELFEQIEQWTGGCDAYRRLEKFVKENSVKEFKFSSLSQEGVIYTVKKYYNGSLSCNCPGWTRHRTCWHCDKVREGER